MYIEIISLRILFNQNTQNTQYANRARQITSHKKKKCIRKFDVGVKTKTNSAGKNTLGSQNGMKE